LEARSACAFASGIVWSRFQGERTRTEGVIGDILKSIKSVHFWKKKTACTLSSATSSKKALDNDPGKGLT
jgi:hypothetical protein